MDDLVVNGYVREIEKSLTNQKIIPIEIYHICFDFYFATKFIFYLSGLAYSNLDSDDPTETLDLMSVVNYDNKQQWNVTMHELSDNTLTLKDAEKGAHWSIDCAGITFARNINIPSNIQHQLSTLSVHSNWKFNNAVFRCGGSNVSYVETNYCSALIFNSRSFQAQQTNIIAYNWCLPSLPTNIYSNFVLYSNEELYSIGGMEITDNGNKIHKLLFDNDIYLQQSKDWRWNEMNTTIPTSRASVCAAMIDKSSKLIIIGGSNGGNDLNTVEMLDIHANGWIKVKDRNHPGIDSGIYYDDCNELVFVGGGFANDNAIETVEFYDVKKNIWIDLPDTNMAHDMNPLLWIEDGDLLHIMSVYGNCIECIDLREPKMWSVKNKDLSNVFDTDFSTTPEDVTISRVVGN